MKKSIYLLDYRLKWKIFKKFQDKIIRDSGPIPKNIDKILWEMIRDRLIYCWFSKDLPNDMNIGLKLPKGRKINLIKNK